MPAVEIENILADIKQQDENLAKRLEPIETAISGIDEMNKTVAELKEAKEELQKALNKSLDDVEDLKKLIKASRDHIYEPGGKYNGGFASREAAKQFGYWIMGFSKGGPVRAKAWEYLDKSGIDISPVQKALEEGVTSEGGALVPEEFIPSLIVLIESYGVVRNLFQTVPMGSDTSIWPKLNSDVTVYAPGEEGSITASDPAFANVKLVPTKLAALTKVSSELAEDAAVAIGEIVGSSMARAFAKAEDQAGLLGDGTSTYWGFVGLTGAFQSLASYSAQTASTALGGLVTAAGNVFSEFTIGNFRTLMGVTPSYAEANAKFVCSKRFYWEVIVRLAQAAGGMLKSEYESSQGKTFLGYPVVYSDVMPKTDANSQQALFFGDFRQGAYLGDRRAFQVDQDASVYFASDQIGIRATERIGINVFGFGDTSSAGPICSMISYAS